MGRLIFLLACVLVVLAAGSARGAVHTIEVMEWTFDPPNVTIGPGDTVRWISVSGSFQVLSSPELPKHWTSPVLDEPGETFELHFTFQDGPGPFPFEAMPNNGMMTGEVRTADTCWASGDINGDGIVLTVADMVYLLRVINGEFPWPDNLYQADLNGDCIIDGGDAYLLNLYFEQGFGVFPVFPVPTCCYPDTVVGACCIEDSCSVRAPIHCDSLGGEYLGHGTNCPLDNNPCVCCVGLTGNVDGDPDDMVNISDLTRFVCWIWGDCEAPTCLEEADINADGTIDILDVTYLASYLFGSGPPPPPCP
jgi:plastocyanin